MADAIVSAAAIAAPVVLSAGDYLFSESVSTSPVMVSVVDAVAVGAAAWLGARYANAELPVMSMDMLVVVGATFVGSYFSGPGQFIATQPMGAFYAGMAGLGYIIPSDAMFIPARTLAWTIALLPVQAAIVGTFFKDYDPTAGSASVMAGVFVGVGASSIVARMLAGGELDLKEAAIYGLGGVAGMYLATMLASNDKGQTSGWDIMGYLAQAAPAIGIVAAHWVAGMV